MSGAVHIPDELIEAGVATAVERLFAGPAFAERVADAICQRFELLTPEEAAALLGVTKRTLADNHVEWGLDKAVAFGPTNPRYFLSQVLERARQKVIKGRGKVESEKLSVVRKAAA
jgi:hypothetical protein